MKRRSIFLAVAVCILLCGLIGAGILYWPREIHTTVYMCSFDGEVLEVEFDVTMRRRIGKEADLKGTVRVGGVEYTSLHGVLPHGNYNVDSLTFVITGENIPFSFIERMNLGEIKFNLAGCHLDYFSMLLREEDKVEEYFGPANTKSEAEEVWRKLQGTGN